MCGPGPLWHLTILMVIVLLNMLIAMITNSFQKIEVHELRPV